MAELPTGTVTFLFTDIEGSTRLLKDLRDRYAAVLEAHQRLLREAFTVHDGIEIDTQGDSFFVVFRRAGDAVAAAVSAQRALAEHEWPEAPVRVRMGLHSGEPAATGETYVGLGVHRAARISAAGHGGQVLLSNATRELVEDDLPNDVRLLDLGEHRLKDIDRPERLFQLEVEGLPTEFPPLKTLAHEPAVAAGRTEELAAAAAEAVGHAPRIKRRVLLAGALAGVIAAAVAIPIFALGRGDSGPGIVRSAAAGANSLVILDTGSAQPVSEVELPTAPLSAAAGEGAIWVTSADGQTVSRIDPETSSIRQSIRVGGGASGVAVGAGDVWVANGLEGTVSRIDADTNEVVQTIKVGNGPSGVAFGEGAIWVANEADHNVMRLDPGTGGVSDTIGVDAGAGAIAFGAGSVWVAGRSSGRVSRIDPRSKLVAEAVAVGRGPSALAVGGGAVWVSNALEGTVSRIDVRTSRVTALAVGIAPSDIAVTESAVWVTDEEGGAVVRVDPERNEVAETVSLGKRPAALVADGDRVYVALRAAGDAHRGGTLTVAATGASVDFLDPARAYGGLSWSVLAVVGDGLTGYRRVGGADGSTLVPDLAMSLPEPTDGGRTYTFQLRPRIRYSDGTPLRASDFRFALERVIEGRTPGSGFFSGIVGASRCLQRKARCSLSAGIVADDLKGTVTFRLSAADPDFLYKLALPFAFAVPQTTPRGDPGRRSVLGTGPYRVTEYLPARRVTLARNHRFREWSSAAQPAGNPETILLRLGVSRTEAVVLAERGMADLAWNGVPPTRLDLLRTQYAGLLHITPGRATYFAFMNTRLPPFDDVRVRRALNFAADRAEFVRATGGETSAAPTCQVLPPNFPGYRRYCPYTENPSSSGEWTAPDLERAKRLVAAAGVRGTEVTLWFADSPPFDAPVEPLADLLRELGFRVRTKAYKDLLKYFDAISDSRTRVQIGLSGWIADYPAPGGFIDVQLSCRSFVPRSKVNANAARFCDREVDRAISRAFELQGTDPRAAAELWTRIDRMIVDRAPWLFTVNPKNVRFVSERVGNYQAHVQWGVLLAQLWVR